VDAVAEAAEVEDAAAVAEANSRPGRLGRETLRGGYPCKVGVMRSVQFRRALMRGGR
jgi:hypothetical protein